MASRSSAPVDPFDPNQMTADQRVAEIASILAGGLRRLRSRAALDPVSLHPESSPTRLDESRKTPLHGRRG